MSELIVIPTVEQINLEHQLAFNKAGEALQHAKNCGLMLLQIKASLSHGEWLPWLDGAVERGELAFGARQAQKYIRRASNTNSSSYLESPSIQEALEIFSDKEPTAEQTDLVGVDVEAERAARIAAEQQAMATALAYPEPTNKGGRGKKNETTVLNTDVSSAYLKHARFVLRNCRDKALEVLRNSKYPLTEAYDLTQADVNQQEGNDPLDIGLNALDTLDKGKHNSNLNVSGFAKRLGKSQGYLTKVFQAATVFSKIIP